MNAIPIAVLASGRGSNFEAILKSIQKKNLQAKILALISDQPDAQVLQIAKAASIPAFAVASPASKEQQEEEILKILKPLQAHFIVLAGYMRILSPTFLAPFLSPRGYFRVTNIHPSLLPAFPGKNAYAQAFALGCKVTGVSVHLLDEKVDHGPICAQEAFSISDLITVQEVEARGLDLEHRLYPNTLNWILQEKFSLEKREGRTCVRQD